MTLVRGGLLWAYPPPVTFKTGVGQMEQTPRENSWIFLSAVFRGGGSGECTILRRA